MNPLVTVNKLPPQGWIYREVIGGRSWTNPDTMLPFWDVVTVIQRARGNNPSTQLSTNAQSIARDLALYTCRRLNYDSRWCVTAVTAEEAALAVKKGKGCSGCGGKKRK